MDGSFLAFRYLEQLVPEFDEFVASNPMPIDGMPTDLAISLAGYVYLMLLYYTH
jgi:hypothetical protein